MTIRMLLLMSAIAIGAPMIATGTATAEDMRDHMMSGGMNMHPKDHETMQGRMGQDMMCPMMRSGMMGPGMTGSATTHTGMGALFGSRVTPVMNLSIDDVRGYLALKLERLNNKRLKIGDITRDDGIITANIVTVDNSLVQLLKVDRHTGAITYED